MNTRRAGEEEQRDCFLLLSLSPMYETVDLAIWSLLARSVAGCSASGIDIHGPYPIMREKPGWRNSQPVMLCDDGHGWVRRERLM